MYHKRLAALLSILIKQYTPFYGRNQGGQATKIPENCEFFVFLLRNIEKYNRFCGFWRDKGEMRRRKTLPAEAGSGRAGPYSSGMGMMVTLMFSMA